MPIRVQIVTERWNPISAAIRYTTRSWASHAEFVDTDRGTTLGARALGGVMIRYSHHDRYTRVEQFVADKPQFMHDAYVWAHTQLGKRYDFAAVTGIAIDRDWRDPERWFCSELVAMAFLQAGAPLLSTRPSDKIHRITPRDLLLSRQLDYLDGVGVNGA